MSHEQMTVMEHLDELRKRLFGVAIFFVVALIGSFFIAPTFITYLQQSPEASALTLNAFRMTDPFKVYIQMTIFLACVVTAPLILFQLWAFISPGLYEKERRVTLSYIPMSVLLFLGGLSFSYFVLFPFVVDFMMTLSGNMEVQTTIGINEYFEFLFQLTLPFGFLFQLPIVMLFLTRLGIVTPMFLASIRKYAYFTLLVIAAFITPPDIMSHILVTLPLCVLYEISIVISRFGYKKAMEAEQQQELEQKSDL